MHLVSRPYRFEAKLMYPIIWTMHTHDPNFNSGTDSDYWVSHFQRWELCWIPPDAWEEAALYRLMWVVRPSANRPMAGSDRGRKTRTWPHSKPRLTASKRLAWSLIPWKCSNRWLVWTLLLGTDKCQIIPENFCNTHESPGLTNIDICREPSISNHSCEVVHVSFPIPSRKIAFSFQPLLRPPLTLRMNYFLNRFACGTGRERESTIYVPCPRACMPGILDQGNHTPVWKRDPLLWHPVL